MDRYQPPLLEQLTWIETRDLLVLRPVGLLPVGAIEAHGPHLPLDTDVIIARGMARSGAAYLHSAGIPSVVLPAVSYSVSYAGACFAGTSPVSEETFQAYVTEILSHHATLGYRAICVCNAHLEPAHVAALGNAVTTAEDAAGIPIVFPDQRLQPWAEQLGDEFNRGSRHAGSYETSIVMVEAPDQVRRALLEELEPVWIDLPAALREGARDFAEAGAALGYLGDPGAATPEHGAYLLERLGEMVNVTVLEALARR